MVASPDLSPAALALRVPPVFPVSSVPWAPESCRALGQGLTVHGEEIRRSLPVGAYSLAGESGHLAKQLPNSSGDVGTGGAHAA